MRKVIGTKILVMSLSLIFSSFAVKLSVAATMDGAATPPVPIPASNPLTPAKIRLGKILFTDRNLSDASARTTQVSCASCHTAKLDFTDGGVVPNGVYNRLDNRNTPTVFNAAYQHSQFWDGRAQYLTDPVSGQVLPGTSLEAQVLGPIQNPLEMNNTADKVVKYVLDKYKASFLDAFPYITQYLGTPYQVPVVFQAVAKAVASFERTILTFNSPYDAYVAGNTAALTDAQVRGLKLFQGKGNCIACHAPPFFTDAAYTNPLNVGFHNLGIFRQGFETGINDATGGPLFPNPTLPQDQGYDLGRYYVTNSLDDLGKFKTPTLRQLSCTAPYMHNGKYFKLQDAVEFTVKGVVTGTVDPYAGQFVGTVDPVITHIRSLSWSYSEISDLTAFLESLTGGKKCSNAAQG